MVKPNVLYRLRQPAKPFDIITASQLVEAVFVEEPADRPSYPASPAAEWYCENSSCQVREVRIEAKYLDRAPPRKPPAMKCPRCGKTMKFHHFLETFTLVPHAEGL